MLLGMSIPDTTSICIDVLSSLSCELFSVVFAGEERTGEETREVCSLVGVCKELEREILSFRGDEELSVRERSVDELEGEGIPDVENDLLICETRGVDGTEESCSTNFCEIKEDDCTEELENVREDTVERF